MKRRYGIDCDLSDLRELKVAVVFLFRRRVALQPIPILIGSIPWIDNVDEPIGDTEIPPFLVQSRFSSGSLCTRSCATVAHTSRLNLAPHKNR